MIDGKIFSMVVLAGGASRRMGRDKADLKLSGKTFLELQIEKGRTLGIQDILVSGYKGKVCSEKIITDNVPGKGPLGGLEACFRQARHEFCLVLSVDVPKVPVSELEKLMELACKSREKAVILKHGDHEESLIGVYRSELADAMKEEITERKGSVFAFLNRIGSEVYITQAEDTLFDNINDPAAYERLVNV